MTARMQPAPALVVANAPVVSQRVLWSAALPLAGPGTLRAACVQIYREAFLALRTDEGNSDLGFSISQGFAFLAPGTFIMSSKCSVQ